MNDVEEAAAALLRMKHSYPATFRAHGLDVAYERLLNHLRARSEGNK